MRNHPCTVAIALFTLIVSAAGTPVLAQDPGRGTTLVCIHSPGGSLAVEEWTPAQVADYENRLRRVSSGDGVQTRPGFARLRRTERGAALTGHQRSRNAATRFPPIPQLDGVLSQQVQRKRSRPNLSKLRPLPFI
jgi:hypothetical protein